MLTLRAPQYSFQYTVLAGAVISIDGKTQPITLDEIEQTYGQKIVENILGAPGEWFYARPLAWTPPAVERLIEMKGRKFIASLAIAGRVERIGSFLSEEHANGAISARLRAVSHGAVAMA